MTDRRLFLILAGALAAAPHVAFAQSDPAIPTIETLNSALVDVMKAGKSLGARGRFDKLMPSVQRAFDLPAMTRFAVGSAWTGYTPAEQAALVTAFGRLTAANLAHNFDSYDGEQCKVNPAVETRGPDKLVRSQIIPAKGSPTDLNYRMHQSGGSWKVIDVYFGAISQLVAQRSDFTATAIPGGASKLVEKINAKADSLMKG